LARYSAGATLEAEGSPPSTAALPFDSTPPTDLPQPLYAFAGIARPNRFFENLKNAGMALAGCRDFPDHHAYRSSDLHRLDREAQVAGAAALITTEKDAVRIPAEARSVETYVWRYRLQPQRPEVLGKWLLGRIRSAKRGAR